MSQMNAFLIHDGRQPSIANAFVQGQRAGQAALESRQQNALNAFYQERGPDLMAGDPEALNALASMGVAGAQNAFNTQSRNEQREAARERLRIVKAEAAQRAEEHALKLSAADRERVIQEIEDGLIKVLPAFESGDQAKLDAALAEVGLNPIPLAEMPYVIGEHEAVHDTLVRGREVAAGPQQDSAAEQEIARLMETGMDRETAIKIKDGVWVVSRDPQTGEAQVIDKATSRPVAAQQAQLAPQPEAAPGTVPELSFGDRYTASPKAFGVGGAFRGAVNAVGDTIGAGQAFPDVADTQSDFGVLRETLVNDLASGYPRQPPSWLLQQIQDLTPRAGSPLQGPQGAQDKLAALGRSVEQELQSIQGQLRNRRLRPTLKQDLEGQAASLQKVLDRVTEAYGSFDARPRIELSPDITERMKAYE